MERLEKRNNIAKTKLSQEFDILNIIKGLRISRFHLSLLLEINELLTKLRSSSMDRMELRQVRSSGRNTRCWLPPESESLRSPPSCSPSCTATGTASKTVQTANIRGLWPCPKRSETWKRCLQLPVECLILIYVNTRSIWCLSWPWRII